MDANPAADRAGASPIHPRAPRVDCASPAVFTFLELFAGCAGLSREVLRSLKELVKTLTFSAEWCEMDVSVDAEFTALLDAEVDWLHAAPPCKSFSRARRTDDVASVRVLRSVERPEGFGCTMTKVANTLALRTIEKAILQVQCGRYFSIEHPLESFMWELTLCKKLRTMPGVRFRVVYQCAAGSQHAKPTGVLTNAPWILDLPCDMATRPHHHVPLRGLVEGFRLDGIVGHKVFYTELAAEYPAGLCELWARGLRNWLTRSVGAPSPSLPVPSSVGRWCGLTKAGPCAPPPVVASEGRWCGLTRSGPCAPLLVRHRWKRWVG